MAKTTLTSASFFSGVGGLDLGFERAGIRTVSFSEIERYQSAVLAKNWPGIPNLGDIVALRDRELSEQIQHATDEVQRHSGHADTGSGSAGSSDWRKADIFTGGFPCQDLSIAGNRKGFRGDRSVLAFTFIDLVERFKPKWLVLENVAGLLTSSEGRDFGRLVSEVEKLGYGVAWRILDAQYFGVPQRRRRVFIVASLGSDRCGQVLFECEGSCRHIESLPQERQEDSISSLRSLDNASHRARHDITVEEDDPYRVRTPNGMARWVDYNEGVIGPLTAGRKGIRLGAEDTSAGHIQVYRLKPSETGPGGDLSHENEDGVHRHTPRTSDSARYACCGNGVVAPVAEWVGRRIIKVSEDGNAFGHV